ncbi:MAG: serine/threonine-protein kinase, partial [Planctomycetota bacterium]
MPDEKDTVLGRLAVERGYATQPQVDEALTAQKAAAAAAGVTIPLAQVMVGKEMLTRDQAQELVNAVAVETGEARLVAGYEVISKLGQGGMGAVYKAKHPTTGLYVALKVLPPSLATGELVKRFQREAEIVRKLKHDNIVGCVEFGFDKRRKLHFCALELVEGEDLAKRIKRSGKLTEDEAVSIACQIAGALQHAYANGLVHRDVKPENVMVTADGTAKLLDLGLARPADTEATRMTQSGMFVGSPYYASPEQALAERDIDIRSDIYSLGATLYHMVTGKPPFEGGTALAILQKHVAEKLPWPAEVNPELSDGLCRVIAKMMEKSPDDRYPTPDDLYADLDLLGGGKEPEVDAAALKNSSVKVPAARRRGHRRPESRARMAPGRDRAAARRPEGRRPDSARARRRERGPGRQDTGEPRAGKSPAVKIAMGAGALGLVVVIGLVMFLGGHEPDRGPPKRGDSRDALRTQPSKVTREPVPPDAGGSAVDTREAPPPAEPPPSEPPP